MYKTLKNDAFISYGELFNDRVYSLQYLNRYAVGC
jgi:hypothetical protein